MLQQITNLKVQVSASKSSQNSKDIKGIKIWKEKNCTKTWDSSAVRGHCKDKLRQKKIIKKSVTAVTVDEGAFQMMYQLLKQRLAPDINIDIFSGNPVDFHYFMVAVNDIGQKKVDDSRVKLTQLIK